MRLIDVDELEYINAMVRDTVDKGLWYEWCVTKDEIEDTPTVEAIPIEEVAEMMMAHVSKYPYSYCDIDINYCDSSVCDSKKCWVHAIKEWWLDE